MRQNVLSDSRNRLGGRKGRKKKNLKHNEAMRNEGGRIKQEEVKGQGGDMEINKRSNEKNGEDGEGEKGPPVERGEAAD